MAQPIVAIVGGGVSGLSAALRLAEKPLQADVRLFEASERLGGVLETVGRDGFLAEAAADSFLTRPASAVELCRNIGFENSLVETEEAKRGVLVLRRGRLLPIPGGFQLMAPSRIWPMVATRVLSLRGKLRIATEFFRPPGSGQDDESLASFVRRRFGREAFDRLVQPLIGGIYGGDPDQLSLAATMPRFQQMEREHGSLLRAMLRERHAARPQGVASRGLFVAPRYGMSSLVQAMAERLSPRSISLGTKVSRLLALRDGKWLVVTSGSSRRATEADAVILALPAYQAARLLESVDVPLSRELEAIEYAGCAVVSLGYQRQQIGRPLNSSGFVAPLAENRTILSCSFSSEKFAGRAPEGAVLLRVFLGGVCQSGLLRLSRRRLAELASQEVSDLLKIRGQPHFRHVVRHDRAMPQYRVGHLARLAVIARRLEALPGLALAGNAYGSVGIPGCVSSGQTAADRVARFLLAQQDIPAQAEEALI